MSRARKTPVQDRSRFMVDVILEAATRVFDREGAAGTTNRIADVAGVSIGSLYQYFPNKHAIMAALAWRHLEESRAALTKLCDRFDTTAPTRVEMVTTMVETVVWLNGSHPRTFAVLREHTPRTPELVDAFTALAADMTARLVPHLIRTGTPSADAPLQARLLAASIDGQVHQLIATAITADDRERLCAAIIAGLMATDQPL